MLTYFCYTGKILVFLINFVIQGDFLVILTLNKRKYLKFCHTERSEVSIQKTESGLLNLWIFRFVLTHSAQNDKFRAFVFGFAWQTNGKFGTEFAIRLLRQAKSEPARRKSQLKSAPTRATKARFACHTER